MFQHLTITKALELAPTLPQNIKDAIKREMELDQAEEALMVELESSSDSPNDAQRRLSDAGWARIEAMNVVDDLLMSGGFLLRPADYAQLVKRALLGEAPPPEVMLMEVIDDEMAALQKMHHLKTAVTQAWLATWVADAWAMQGGTIPASFADLCADRDELRAKFAAAEERANTAQAKTRAAIEASGLALPTDGERLEVLMLTRALLHAKQAQHHKEPAP
jgi:hypothetical protein